MTLTEQVKILDDKIKVNQARYDLEKLLKYLHYLLKNWTNTNI